MIFSIIAFTSFVSLPVSASSSFLQILEEEEELGCCYDKTQGTCSPLSAEEACTAEGDTEWYADSLCNIDGGRCDRGCCKIGQKNIWITASACEKQSGLQGIISEFDRSVATEIECISMTTENNLGACVYEIGYENTCTFTSGVECESINGRFYEDYLCSNAELNTSCIKQSSISCMEGRDGIYWYDSCGNPENIYSSDETKSWNGGKVLSPSESCNPSSSNSNSNSCGNCDYNDGSICKEATLPTDKKMKAGDFTCRDLNCEDAPLTVNAKGKVLKTQDRLNGESWCVYDGPIGGFGILGGEVSLFSQDLIGSRHYRYICSNGEVEVDPCQDYRQEICVEQETEAGRSSAACRVNSWEQCLAKNQDGECGPGCMVGCVANPDCRVQAVNVGPDFKFQMCVPKYPPGFEGSGISGLIGAVATDTVDGLGDIVDTVSGVTDAVGLTEGTSSKDVCSLGTKTCVSTWVKECPSGKWTCINNCECHTQKFTTQMNNLCVSLGDCGTYPNLLGNPVFSYGTKVKKDGSHGATPMQPIILGIVYMALSFLPSTKSAAGGGFDSPSDILDLSSGTLGGLLGIVDPFLGNLIGINGGTGADFDGGSQLGNMFSSGGTYATLGSAMLVGLAGTAAVLSTDGLVSLLLLFPEGGLLGPMLILMVVVLVAMYLAGCGTVEQVEITYTCAASNSVIGSSCDKCNGDPLKPCSRYKCESLGAACKLINENTGLDECVKIDGIDTLPVITPFEEVLNQTMFQYKDVSSNGFRIRTADDECIQAFTAFSFGVKTDIPAICAIGEEPMDFAEMSGGFLEGGIYSYNHTSVISLPSIESLIYTTIGDGKGENDEGFDEAYDEAYEFAKEEMANLDLYVKCINPLGDETEADFKINVCVNPGPDLDSPIMVGVSPPENTILKLDATSQNTTFYTNEPADCKWGKENPNLANAEDNYNALENTMTCEAKSKDASKGYYPCSTNLPITNKSNEFYVLCKDQPWLGEEDDELRNIGAVEGSFYKYTLRVSESELKIDSVEPSGKMLAGAEPVTVEISAKTSGGAYSGEAICGYKFANQDPENTLYTEFLSTGETATHVQPGLQFPAGNRTLNIKCYDEAGNKATGQTIINLELDTTPPVITRVYNKGGLKVITNEESECSYNLKTCKFNESEGVSMTTGISLVHSADWNPDLTYHIRCKDIWENSIDSCSIIVRPGQLLS